MINHYVMIKYATLASEKVKIENKCEPELAVVNATQSENGPSPSLFCAFTRMR